MARVSQALFKTPPAPIPIFNVGSVGVIKDLPDHTLPPEAWSDANNVKFLEGVVRKTKGRTSIFGTPTIAPFWHLNVTGQSQTYWLHASLTKIYAYEGGVFTNITRQSASVDVDYAAANGRDWNGGILGGIPILNNGSDVPQYWPTISVGTKLSDLSSWPANLTAKIVKPFGSFLLAMNILDTGNSYPNMVWWSHPADPGSLPTSWDYSDATKDAGRFELTDIAGGDIVDGLMLGNYFIVYKELSTHVIRYIGGRNIMGSDLIFTNSGIMAPRCMTDFKKGTHHFVATLDDFIYHSGQKNSIESAFDAKDRRYIRADIDSTNYVNSFCFENSPDNEVWFCYPVDGQTYPNKAAVWNYKYNTVQFVDFKGTFASSGDVQLSSPETWASVSGGWDADTEPWAAPGGNKIVVSDFLGTQFLQQEEGFDFEGDNITSYLERTGIAIVGRDRSGQPKVDYRQRKLLTRVWPKFKGDVNVTVRVGSQDVLGGTVTWQDTKTFDASSDQLYVDVIAEGRLLAIRFEVESSVDWQCDGYDMEVALLGEH